MVDIEFARRLEESGKCGPGAVNCFNVQRVLGRALSMIFGEYHQRYLTIIEGVEVRQIVEDVVREASALEQLEADGKVIDFGNTSFGLMEEILARWMWSQGVDLQGIPVIHDSERGDMPDPRFFEWLRRKREDRHRL